MITRAMEAEILRLHHAERLADRHDRAATELHH